MQKRKLGKSNLEVSAKTKRLEEDLGAAAVELTPEDLREIESAAAKITVHGERYPERLERMTGR